MRIFAENNKIEQNPLADEVFYPFSGPLYLVAKPASSTCNMRCEYCYYLEKSAYYPSAGRKVMDPEMLETFISGFIASQNTPDVLFNWHGGEPLLCGLDFFRKAVELQKRYGRGHRIINTIQTNGTLLDAQWCDFFRENGFLVGISLDGPRECHDRYRRMAGGGASFDAVMRGIEALRTAGVEFNILCTVNDYNACRPLEVYEFFKGLGTQFVQFTPVVERLDPQGGLLSGDQAGGVLTPWSVRPKDWGQFLTDIFFRWVKNDVGDFFVNVFDATLAGYVGVDPGNCYFARSCGHALALEYNGDVYACDHYVFPRYRLCNLRDTPLRTLSALPFQQAFGAGKTANLPRECLACRYRSLCNGECPKNRIVETGEKGRRLNYLCRGYKHFFARTEPYFRFMALELAAGRNVLAVREVKF